ncbi:MMPL family transporter [Paenibacillus tundrae]|uniref:MMPL family transporter n=1 Tax=Paenibacillus tundrae TaxID=528187 RepID=UPI0022A91EA6|nr:MMPL family transporter [Paenibacillus tundrae]MCZ1267527.1 MMPL family transporter [Paenibacillus tundrae]
MSKLRNPRTLSLILWILITVVSVMTMPDFGQLVKEKGEISIPETAQSQIAATMMKDMDKDSGNTYSIIAVFNSGEGAQALTKQQKTEIESVLSNLKNQKKQLNIETLTTHLDGEEQADRLISEDETTILTQITVTKDEDIPLSEVVSQLNEATAISDVNTYLTGADLIGDDFGKSIEDGVQKTEIIAVIFILVILIIIFRSPIIPVISLLTVGISYVVSLAIVGHLVDMFNFPFSNFTQVFMVVILFGIGTDYNILLYTRFKEELSRQGGDVLLATKTTFRTAGRTVLYSGIAVFIGFLALMLAKFQLYQATSSVAFAVAVLIVVLNTLNPFFMVVLGKKMFWPSRKFEGHADSRLWGFLSRNAASRPVLAIIFVAVISIPFLFSYSNRLSYNDLFEVNNNYTSKQGINLIMDHYPPGFSAPTTLVVQSKQSMDNQTFLKALDDLTDKVFKMDGVSVVYSVTRPTGTKIKELYINDQADELNQGIGKANNGLGTINEGLSSAAGQLQSSNDLSDVQQLIDGTSQLQEGVAALGKAMNQVTVGLNDGRKGADTLKNGLATLREKVDILSKGTTELHQGYADLEQGLGSFRDTFNSMKTAIQGALDAYAQIESSMTRLITNHPELQQEEDTVQIIGITQAAQSDLNKLYTQMDPLMVQYNGALGSFKEANKALAQVNQGLTRVTSGVGQLEGGAGELSAGLVNGASGSKQIAGKTSEVGKGLVQINQGQNQLLTGLNDLQAKMGELKSGLTASTEGLTDVSKGLGDAEEYLGNLGQSDAAKSFYIPEEVLTGEEFQASLDTYMSDDRKTAEISIILTDNPYSKEAMDVVQNLSNQLNTALVGTDLSEAKVALGGVPSQNLDLQKLAGGDLSRTSMIMLIGIGLILLVIIRSFWQSVIIVGSLFLTYYVALGLNELLVVGPLNVDYLSWNVPFFSLIMIVTLGVDYSIFLMMRYREIEGDPVHKITEASRNIGGVVISAAVILGGTFAALIPSGVVTLIEVAISVIIGLVLLSFVMLPILLPALISLLHKLAKWGSKSDENK